MSKISRVATWTCLSLALLIGAPAAASAAVARPMVQCQTGYNWDIATQSCVYVG